jgi:hypothetical protein
MEIDHKEQKTEEVRNIEETKKRHGGDFPRESDGRFKRYKKATGTVSEKEERKLEDEESKNIGKEYKKFNTTNEEENEESKTEYSKNTQEDRKKTRGGDKQKDESALSVSPKMLRGRGKRSIEDPTVSSAKKLAAESEVKEEVSSVGVIRSSQEKEERHVERETRQRKNDVNVKHERNASKDPLEQNTKADAAEQQAAPKSRLLRGHKEGEPAGVSPAREMRRRSRKENPEASADGDPSSAGGKSTGGEMATAGMDVDPAGDTAVVTSTSVEPAAAAAVEKETRSRAARKEEVEPQQQNAAVGRETRQRASAVGDSPAVVEGPSLRLRLVFLYLFYRIYLGY